MQTITIPILETVYRRLQRAAEIAGKPVNEIAAQSIQDSLPPLLEVVPQPYRTDLATMEAFSDTDLWNVARAQVTVKDQRRFRRLRKKKSLGPLTEREQTHLTELRRAIDLVMFRKAYAYLLLKWRGCRVPTFLASIPPISQTARSHNPPSAYLWAA